MRRQSIHLLLRVALVRPLASLTALILKHALSEAVSLPFWRLGSQQELGKDDQSDKEAGSDRAAELQGPKLMHHLVELLVPHYPHAG